MAVAPHSLAAEAALRILREGGNAIEAMVAAAAAIAVVYPHMNSIGGDAFWTIYAPGHAVFTIEAAGPAARAATRAFYTERGLRAIPPRGPLAANTVAGAVGGWALALEVSACEWNGRLAVPRLLEDAIWHAGHGIAVTAAQSRTTRDKRAELEGQPGFRGHFMPGGKPPEPRSVFVQRELAATLRHLAAKGLDDFYRGELADAIGTALHREGSPLTRDDLAAYRARVKPPLKIEHSSGTLYNTGLPTQGLVSLLILALADRLKLAETEADSADYVHLLVEATKRAFLVRDRHVTDPAFVKTDVQSLLDDENFLAGHVRAISRERAAPWGKGRAPADTVWLGVIDGAGRAVSFIQSLYHEFGSGMVLGDTGILWQNRGSSFSLDADNLNALEPGRLPFHTLNPALALLARGRVMIYGTMGGDGQPQTQAALFTRTVVFGQELQQAIAAPRWLLGRTWGQATDTLKLESRFSPELIEALRARGHEIEMLDEFDERVGHAGALLLHPSGVIEGAADPRSDGAAAGF
ncbi:MAG: gamma-glutamyltransferase family protein [Acetobacteraceae bacterium]